MLDHGFDQLCLAQGRVGQVQVLVFVFTAAQQLARTDAQLAEQGAEGSGIWRGFQVADHGRGQATGFEQFQRAAGFGAARIVIEGQVSHVRVASSRVWRLF
ncbi:hypothetical protein D3C76_1169810 [compost metagenome]